MDDMPIRLLRPTIRQSKRWNRCSWVEQSLFIRLLTLVDDFGRYEADPELIRSEAFPYGDPEGNVIDVRAIDGALLSFARKDMICLYQTEEGTKYLSLNRWKERLRAKESRYPDPKCCQMTATCGQMTASPPSPPPPTSPPTTDNSDNLQLSGVGGNGEWNPTKEQIRLGRIFSRRSTTRWSNKEIKAWKAITPVSESDLSMLERYYSANLPETSDYRRHDLSTLLNNFTGELDRARNFKEPLPY